MKADIANTHKKTAHAVGRNLDIYKERIRNDEDFTPRDYFYYGNELRENGHYKEAIENYSKNIQLKEGWIEVKVYACINRAYCYRILGGHETELTNFLVNVVISKTRR